MVNENTITSTLVDNSNGLTELSRVNSETNTKTVKVMQFGEGNFLRAFVDWMIHKTNTTTGIDMGVVIVQPLETGRTHELNKQDNLYHVVLEGVKEGKLVREMELIECVVDAINPYESYELYREYFLSESLEFVISNTTEAGISRVRKEDLFANPPTSFPGKITNLLYQRFHVFCGAPDKGLTFICCELIENNATVLREIVLELAVQNNLGSAFVKWVQNHCEFCNSLVDRIVTGYPKDTIQEVQKSLGFKDSMVVVAEYYHVWAIQGSPKVRDRFPLHKAGLNVVWLSDLKEFRDKKVRVLNGSHTALVSVGLLFGYQTVKETFDDPDISSFVTKMISEEVLPTIAGDAKELKEFADEILERFLNPYIKHYLQDIALNSLSKWKTRNYPSLVDFAKDKGVLPKYLTFSLACLVFLYSPMSQTSFEPSDEPDHLDRLKTIWSGSKCLATKVETILSDVSLWGEDNTTVPGLCSSVVASIVQIERNGVEYALRQLQM